MKIEKLQAWSENDGDWLRHNYGNKYFRQPCGHTERLVIGPSSQQVKLLDALAKTFTAGPYYILYVLLVSHADRSPGRYQSPLFDSHEDLQLFLYTFQEFFENDGRHHVWISTPEAGTLVYDQHDVIFAYGDLDLMKNVIVEAGFHEEEFWFPSPHRHGFDPRNVDRENELMAYCDWVYFDLQPDDDWDEVA